MSNKKVEIATFGGGCFWCIEAVINKLRGIISITSGYAAGHDSDPDYKKVCTGETGHAEVIQVDFDASILSYKDLLEVFMTSHDPTQLNGQGNDIGTQYRSIILYHDLPQKHTAETLLESLSGIFEQPIVTQLEPLTDFYAAEEYHQDYYARNPDNQYCMAVIDPKVAKLRKLHAEKLFQEKTVRLN